MVQNRIAVYDTRESREREREREREGDEITIASCKENEIGDDDDLEDSTVNSSVRFI